MTTQVFPPKISWWLFGLIIVLVAGSGLLPLVRPPEKPPELLALLLPLAAAIFMLYLLLTTHYRLTAEHLLVRSGFFRWQIPTQRITRVSETYNPLSAPAPSLDRLKIHYHAHSSLMISPRDKAGFIAALRQVNSGIQVGQVLSP